MLSDRCPICLSVLLIYCGQAVRWIKMKLGTEVGLGAEHIVFDGNPASPKNGAQQPQFAAHVCCGQTAGCIKMPLGMEVCLSPGHIVLDGDPGSLIKGHSSPTIFGPCLLWPNGWMDQDATWYRGRPRPWRHCVRRGPSPVAKGAQPPKFSAHACCGQTAVWIKMPLGTNRPWPRQHCVRWDPAPPKRGTTPLLFGPCLL